MARSRRINAPGAYHHITARGVDRSPIFEDDQDRRQFLSLLRESQMRFGCQVLAFCLMTNHLHLTLRDDRGNLSKTQHFLNGVYAKRFNRRHNRTGHLFERRFWSSMLDSDAYLTTCVAYVHQNPVEAGMVANAAEYRWSSYPSYVGRRSSPDFLNTSIVLDHYGHDVTRLRSATEGLVSDTMLLNQLRSLNPPAVLRRDAGEARGPRRPPEVGEARQLLPLEEVLRACAGAFDLDVDHIRTGKRGQHNPARGLAALVAQRYVGHSLTDTARALNLKSPAAASTSAQRFANTLHGSNQQMLGRALTTLGLASSELRT